jgi:hypothetical protein
MKRGTLIMVALLLAAPAVVFAQEYEQTLSIGASLNYWLASWDQDNFDSNNAGMFGPKLSVTYGRFGVGILYTSGSFDLDLQGGAKADASRQDLDLVFHYTVLDFLGVSAGYKRFAYDYKMSSDVKADWTFQGFGIGVSSAYPIGDTGLAVYGALAYLPVVSVDSELRFAGEKATDSGKATGFTLEIGGGYVLPTIPLSFDLAYRYQRVSTKDLGEDLTDTFGGPILEIGYTF